MLAKLLDLGKRFDFDQLAVRHGRILQWYFAVIYAFSFTQADRLANKKGWLPTSPTWFFVVVALPVVIWALLSDISGPRRGGRLLELAGRNLTLVVPFWVLAALSLLWSLHPTANWSSGILFIALVPFAFLVTMVTMTSSLLKPIRDGFWYFVFLSWLALVVTVFLDLVSPGLFSDQASRAAGLAEDSNVSAFLMLSACSLLVSYGRSLRRDGIFLAVTSALVLLTFSRGGVVLLGVLLLSYSIQFRKRGESARSIKRWIPVAVVAVVAVLVLGGVARMAASGSESFRRPVTQQRIGMMTGGVHFLSKNDHRIQVLTRYSKKVAAAPVLGYGTGFSYTYDVGPHNRYLQEWLNLGILGLLSYLAILFCALATFWIRRSAMGVTYSLMLLVWSMLSQGVLEQRSVPMTLGLLAAVTLVEAAKRDSEASDAV